jgi:hypothetical protein
MTRLDKKIHELILSTLFGDTDEFIIETASGTRRITAATLFEPTNTSITNEKNRAVQAETDLAARVAYVESSVHYKGSVATFSALPASPKVGDMYNVVDDETTHKQNLNYAWDGKEWDSLGSTIDMSLYYTKPEINGFLDLKANVADVYTKSEVDSKDSTEKTRATAAESALATSITNITPLANAGSHNLYRGKYLGTAVTNVQYTAISNGTFADLFVGDYWTIGGINWVIAGFDYYANCGDNAVLGHHAVIVPATNLYSAKMNDSNVTTGAYVGSAMYTTNLASAKTTISGIFGTHLKTHRILLQNAMSNGYPSGGIWADSTVDLMSEVMVYGTHHFSSMADGTTIPYEYACEDSQLPLMAQNKALIHTRQDYWLRDAVSASNFARVNGAGNCVCVAASDSVGVRPAFCIS